MNPLRQQFVPKTLADELAVCLTVYDDADQFPHDRATIALVKYREATMIDQWEFEHMRMQRDALASLLIEAVAMLDPDAETLVFEDRVNEILRGMYGSALGPDAAEPSE